MDSFNDETMTNSSSTGSSTSSNIYTVQEGDTLSEILAANHGNGSYEYYTEFAKNNGIENPDLIYPGQEIKLDNYNNNATTPPSDTSGDIILDSVEEKELLDDTNLDSPASSNTSGDIILDSAEEKELLDDTNLDSPAPSNANSVSQSTITDEKKSTGSNASSSPATTNANKGTVSRSASTSTNYANVPVSYRTSTYTICTPRSVKGWKPLNSFKRFIIKQNAGEEFVAVHQRIIKCSNDIDGIVNALNKLKTTMGDNTGTTTQIDKVITGLNEKKQDLLTKEKELIDACNQVVQYVYANKANKSQEAQQVAATIAGIQL